MRTASQFFIAAVMATWIIGSNGNAPAQAEEALEVATFAVDASPPVGTPLAYDPTRGVQTPLSCRGIVLLGAGDPIVLCAVDWIGISNGGNRLFRESLARAAGTSIHRVAVHALHQHDAPRCDFSVQQMLSANGIEKQYFSPRFAREVIRRAAEALKQAITKAQPVTHIGLSEAKVNKVASNRRILGPDGNVKSMRWTSMPDPKIRAFPVGTIDPMLKMISLWNGDEPIVALTYYACHPQSYYRTGLANPDFPGLARNMQQKLTGIVHVHFNGAGGNIGAGKWNDGSHENRQILAYRVALGMAKALKFTKKYPLEPADVAWETVAVSLPPGDFLDEEQLVATLENEKTPVDDRAQAARRLVWLRRCQAGDTIDVACLSLGKARVLHMPGELFVEYQLAAQKMRPDLFVAMAAYGDLGSGYIGTAIAYSRGGYETSHLASRVAPGVEEVLMGAMRTLLDADQAEKSNRRPVQSPPGEHDGE